MFGGYFELKGLGEDAARRMRNIWTTYRQLEHLDNQHFLLKLLVLRENPTTTPPYPDIFPIHFSYRVTPKFIDIYKQHQPLETFNLLIDYAEGLEKYVADMEREIKVIQARAK